MPLVDLGPLGVVDAGDDVLDAEGLAGHPGADDVGVVAAADRGEGAGGVDAGVEQRLPVEAEAGHLAAGEVRAEPAEGLGVLVDDRDAVPDLLQPAGDGGADAAAAHHDHVHEILPAEVRRAGAVRRRVPARSYTRHGRPAARPGRVPLARAGRAARRAAPAAGDVRTIAAVPSLSDLGQLPKRLVLGRPVRSDRAGRVAAAQAPRAADLRQRRALLRGLRDRRRS